MNRPPKFREDQTRTVCQGACQNDAGERSKGRTHINQWSKKCTSSAGRPFHNLEGTPRQDGSGTSYAASRAWAHAVAFRLEAQAPNPATQASWVPETTPSPGPANQRGHGPLRLLRVVHSAHSVHAGCPCCSTVQDSNLLCPAGHTNEEDSLVARFQKVQNIKCHLSQAPLIFRHFYSSQRALPTPSKLACLFLIGSLRTPLHHCSRSKVACFTPHHTAHPCHQPDQAEPSLPPPQSSPECLRPPVHSSTPAPTTSHSPLTSRRPYKAPPTASRPGPPQTPQNSDPHSAS